jgi:hypothetical protein
MRVKNKFTGKVFEAEWSFKNSASSFAQPVLILKPEGQPVDAIFFEVLDEEENKAEKTDLDDPRD